MLRVSARYHLVYEIAAITLDILIIKHRSHVY